MNNIIFVKLNFMNMKKILLLAFLIFSVVCCITSCVGGDNCQNCSPMEITRLDKVVYDYLNLSNEQRIQVDSVMQNGISAVIIMLNMGHPDDSAFIKYVSSDAVKMFTPEVEKCFGNMSELEEQLGCIKANLENKLPQIKFHDIYTIVSPYRQSIYMADSTMLLALNHYLGENHEAYNGFDEYIKRTKDAKYIPYDIVEALIGSLLPFETCGNDILLAKMLYAGAIVEAKMQIVPNASLAKALGYSDDELEWVKENELNLWNALVSKELLYSTSYLDFKQLLLPAPNTSVLHAGAPGRVGVYLGYKIIESYMKKYPDMVLQNLFESEFYQSQQSLVASGYQGK